jgi:hypothetical protein
MTTSTRGKPAWLVEIVDYVNGRRVVTYKAERGPAVSNKLMAQRMTQKEAKAYAASWNSPRWGCTPKPGTGATAIKDDPPAQAAALRCPTGESTGEAA